MTSTTGCAELRQPTFEEAPLGVVVDQPQRSAIRVARLVRSPEAPQQLAPGRVQIPVVVEVQAVDDAGPAPGPSASATATARVSSTTGEPVRRESSP
jgi:hypothetical protein